MNGRLLRRDALSGFALGLKLLLQVRCQYTIQTCSKSPGRGSSISCSAFSTVSNTRAHPSSPSSNTLSPLGLVPPLSRAGLVPRAYSILSGTVTENPQDLYSSEILPSSSSSPSSPTTTSTSTTTTFSVPSSSPTASAIGTQRAGSIQRLDTFVAPKQPPPRLGPNEGRSVAVRNGDLQGALLRLQRIVSENKIKSDHHKQKFHERKGLKRKRLRSERYRKRFKEGFKKMVGVVLEMRRQGL